MIDRRTGIVLASLLGALTLTSGLLLVLAPGPTVTPGGIQLAAIDPGVQPEQMLFQTRVTPETDRWEAIVIHFSGVQDRQRPAPQPESSVTAGYHFVVDNGVAAPDGRIEVTRRWQLQLDGRHSAGPHADWYNGRAIGICLAGESTGEGPSEKQMQALTWLVGELQDRFAIDAGQVVIDPRIDGGGFPVAWFRQQLRTVSGS
ncbi:MAG: peptidoglycan recognition family protein [Phycisphaeraceae bacterium]|nr:peptidoglycan recognition family protein [Phycisphaeraceae bacterium]